MVVLNRKPLHVCLVLVRVDEVDQDVGRHRDTKSMASKTAYKTMTISKTMFVAAPLFPTG
jgi:hypothetical protein